MSCCCFCPLRCFTMLVTVTAILLGFFFYVDQSAHWVYDPARLQQIAQEGMQRATDLYGEPTPNQIVEQVVAGVMEVYPQTSQNTGRWLWNNAGGAMGSMMVLHCSFSEYLIIFGTPVGTEGHTGRFFAEDFFTILYGEQWAGLPGVAPREVYRPGDQHYLPRRTAKQYRMPDECWALEYARGNIASMMLFGFMDALSSTADYVTIYHTVRESAGNMIPNILRGKI